MLAARIMLLALFASLALAWSAEGRPMCCYGQSGETRKPAMVVPCVRKHRTERFCYLERDANVCTSYSYDIEPSYATYKECANKDYGVPVKCSAVPKSKQTGSYADCLDAEPTAAQKAGTQAKPAVTPTATPPGAKPAAGGWSQRVNTDIKGNDYACNKGKLFCQVCGKSVADIQKQCVSTTWCKSFTTDKKGCFYLKTAAGKASDLVSRTGFDTYVLA